MPDPSSETVTAVTPSAETTTQDVKPAESSAADQGVKSSLDAVNVALGTKKTEASPTSEQGPKDTDPNSTPKSDDAAPDEEIKKFSEAAQHRIRELVGQRKSAEAEVEPLRKEVETLRPQAENFQAITSYMQQHEITPDHLNTALAITAMMNAGDFTTALPILERLVGQARAGAGEVLPSELQQQVNLGYITEAHAKELHKARMNASQTEQRATKERQQRQESDHQTAIGQMVQSAATAADKWTAEKSSKDPDWNQKQDLVTERMELLLHKQGPAKYPRNEQEVRVLLDQALKDVEAKIGRFRPSPKPIAPPVAGGTVSPRSAAKPASSLDALNQGLARAHGG